MQFLTNLNLSQNELQNAVLQPLASAPSTGKLGQMYYNSTDKLLYIYDGSAWRAAGSVVSVAGKTGIVTLVKGDVGLGNVDNTSDATKKANFTGQVADGNTGFVTGDMVYDAIANLGAVLNFKGTVATALALPTTGMKKGDVYIVTADNSEYVWTSDSATGTSANYEKLGTLVDLTGYAPLNSPAFTGAPTAPTISGVIEDPSGWGDSDQLVNARWARNIYESRRSFTGVIRGGETSATVTLTIPQGFTYCSGIKSVLSIKNGEVVVTDTSVVSNNDTYDVTFSVSSPLQSGETIFCYVVAEYGQM